MTGPNAAAAIAWLRAEVRAIVDERSTRIGGRVAGLEGKTEGLESRLGQIEERLASLEGDSLKRDISTKLELGMIWGLVVGIIVVLVMFRFFA